jgi:hypothetical protein
MKIYVYEVQSPPEFKEGLVRNKAEKVFLKNTKYQQF